MNGSNNYPFLVVYKKLLYTIKGVATKPITQRKLVFCCGIFVTRFAESNVDKCHSEEDSMATLWDLGILKSCASTYYYIW